MQFDSNNNILLNDTNQSIELKQEDAKRYRPGGSAGNTNLMIYSTLAAAFPYAHKAVPSSINGDKDETP